MKCTATHSTGNAQQDNATAKNKAIENYNKGENKMKISERTYKLTGMTRILGAQAANPKVHSEFIASKAASLNKSEEETRSELHKQR